MTGATGTGKSFIACALVHQACRRGCRGYYRRVSRLLKVAPVGGAVGLMAVGLLLVVGSSAGISTMTRTLPEDEAPAFRSAGSVAAGSGQGRRVGLQDLTPDAQVRCGEEGAEGGGASRMVQLQARNSGDGVKIPVVVVKLGISFQTGRCDQTVHCAAYREPLLAAIAVNGGGSIERLEAAHAQDRVGSQDRSGAAIRLVLANPL